MSEVRGVFLPADKAAKVYGALHSVGHPRWLSIGSIDNTVEFRMSAGAYKRFCDARADLDAAIAASEPSA